MGKLTQHNFKISWISQNGEKKTTYLRWSFGILKEVEIEWPFITKAEEDYEIKSSI